MRIQETSPISTQINTEHSIITQDPYAPATQLHQHRADIQTLRHGINPPELYEAAIAAAPASLEQAAHRLRYGVLPKFGILSTIPQADTPRADRWARASRPDGLTDQQLADLFTQHCPERDLPNDVRAGVEASVQAELDEQFPDRTESGTSTDEVVRIARRKLYQQTQLTP